MRQVGEPIAACVADTRAEAEDIAAEIEVDFEELPAVVDMIAARAPDAPLVHEEWGDNVYLESLVDGDVDSVRDKAAIRITREMRTARQCMMPIEGRGVVAAWDPRLEQLVVHSAAQMPRPAARPHRPPPKPNSMPGACCFRCFGRGSRRFSAAPEPPAPWLTRPGRLP